MPLAVVQIQQDPTTSVRETNCSIATIKLHCCDCTIYFSRNKYLHEQWSLLLSTFRYEILLYYQLAVIPVERSILKRLVINDIVEATNRFHRVETMNV